MDLKTVLPDPGAFSNDIMVELFTEVEAELQKLTNQLITGGYTTTADSIGNAMLRLLLQPRPAGIAPRRSFAPAHPLRIRQLAMMIGFERILDRLESVDAGASFTTRLTDLGSH